MARLATLIVALLLVATQFSGCKSRQRAECWKSCKQSVEKARKECNEVPAGEYREACMKGAKEIHERCSRSCKAI